MNRKKKTIKELEAAAVSIRTDLLELATKEVMHIGGDLSITDVVTVLWQYQMKYDPRNPEWEERDRFILSKGHTSAVASFNQAAIGCFSREEVLETYAKDESRFSMHACNLINPYVDFSTGSLGHGMPVALGMAAGLRLKGNYKSRVYVIMGDGEQSEGSVWEGVMNAAFHKLGNLVVFIDNNGIGGDAPLTDSTSLGDIAEKYSAFGWQVAELNGNNIEEIKNHLDNLPPADADRPIVFVCNTVKGKGVSFMENNAKWHCGAVTAEQFDRISTSLRKEYEKKWGVECL